MKKKYSTGLYLGFDSRKKKWWELTSKEKKDALNRQWYVRWSYRNPKNGKLERQDNIYGNANSFSTYRDRTAILKVLKKNLEELLKNGNSPYESNPNGPLSAFDAIEEAMEIKRLHMTHDSFIRFKSDIRKFKSYLENNGFKKRFITSVTKKTVSDYLNWVLLQTNKRTGKKYTTRTRNNYKTSLGTLWQCMVDEGLVEKNIVKPINMLKSIPKKNKPFTEEEFNLIVKYLHKNDKRMLLAFYFITYNVLRPKEVCRLDVGCFNIPNKTLRVKVKGGNIATRLIPSIMFDQMPSLEGFDKSVHIIGRTEILQKWDIQPESKRGRISDTFRSVKDVLGFGEEYGLYSGRHYAITKMYRGLRKKFAPFQAKSELMLITGHKSMKALEKYLREIGAELPEDYSSMLA